MGCRTYTAVPGPMYGTFSCREPIGTAPLPRGGDPGEKVLSPSASDFEEENDDVGDARRDGLGRSAGDPVGFVKGCRCSEEGENEGSRVERTGMCRSSRGDMGIGIATEVVMTQAKL